MLAKEPPSANDRGVALGARSPSACRTRTPLAGRLIPAPIVGLYELGGEALSAQRGRGRKAGNSSSDDQDPLDVGHVSSPRRFEPPTRPQRPNHFLFTPDGLLHAAPETRARAPFTLTCSPESRTAVGFGQVGRRRESA